MLKLTVIVLALLTVAVHAEPDAPPRARSFQAHPESPARTVHTVTIDGQQLTYLAEADIIELCHDPETPTARLFTISYRKATLRRAINDLLTDEQQTELDRVIACDGIARDSAEGRRAVVSHLLSLGIDPIELLVFPASDRRPVTFSFNGGPGSSSVWLHVGIFGPRHTAYSDVVGHMMYIHEPSRLKLCEDLVGFYKRTLSNNP